LVRSIGGALAVRGAAQAVDLDRHQSFGREGQQLADQVRIGALLDQLEKRHPLLGHRRLQLQVQASQPEP
jgi:hypothetical protein